ncbi:MAG: alpha/beta hydrolase [Actinomycetota bacterium]
MGHSYGSTTAALATRWGMVVDDLALVGSPGAASRFRFQLAGARQVWAGTKWNDPIRLVANLTLGADPDSIGFGARHLHLGWSQNWHGEYFKENSRGVRNLARIILGRDDQL